MRDAQPPVTVEQNPDRWVEDTLADTGWKLKALHHLERRTEQQLYTGPGAGSELVALRHLEYIAAEQAAGPETDTFVFSATPISRAPWPPQPTFTPHPGLAKAPARDTWVRPASPQGRARDNADAAARDWGDRGIICALRDILSIPWALYAVLGVQTFLSLRLIWANTAFLDEATYVWAGRVEIWHWTTGTSQPGYPTYFSGAPVIYPPLAGLADMIGGVTAARILSLAFMLGVTCMLWGTTRSLFGQRAGLAAVALFTIIGSTQFLGALATYDAMALFLLTLSVRLVVAARTRDDSTWLLIAAVFVLVLANATKYATGLFDPVVFAVAVLTSPRDLKVGVGRGGYLATVTMGLLGALLAVGGSLYVTGVESTTLSRNPGTSAPFTILEDSARWIGFVIVLALVALAVGGWRDRRRAAFLGVLVVAGVLVPANQARIHTTVSLLKHVDFGAWFACIAAGYAIAVLTTVSRRVWLRGIATAAACTVILLPAGAPGRAQASGFEDAWPNTTVVVNQLQQVARDTPGVYLAEDPQVLGYYFEKQIRWQSWQDTAYFGYRPPGTAECLKGSTAGLSGAALAASPVGRALAEAIAHQYFQLIVLNFTDTVAVDHEIKDDITRFRNYHIVADPKFSDRYGHGTYLVWAPSTPTSGSSANSAVRTKGGDHGSSC